MKTIEEIYMDVQERECPKVNNLTLPEDWQLKAMQEYASQKIELAVEKALDITSEKAVQLKENAYSLSSNGLRKEIISLRTQILNEIKDR